MFCPSCGAQNDGYADNCIQCGAQLSAAQPYDAVAPVSVSTYLVPAILTTLFCCQPFGIVAIIFAAITMSNRDSGNHAAAMDASDKARLWCWIAAACGIIPWLIGVLFFILSLAGAAAGAVH